jgi:hypothetical protein
MSAYIIKAFIIFTFLMIVMFDIYLFQDKVKGNTISAVLRAWFLKVKWLYYVVCFGLGVLMAHWGPL